MNPVEDYRIDCMLLEYERLEQDLLKYETKLKWAKDKIERLKFTKKPRVLKSAITEKDKVTARIMQIQNKMRLLEEDIFEFKKDK